MRAPLRTVRVLLAAAFALLLASSSVLADDAPPPAPSPQIREIVIAGARMVEEATVRARIGSREGSPYDTEQVSKDVRSIFELGSFEDVKVDAEGFEGGMRLTFRLTERPLLIALEIEGNKEIKTEDLREKAALALTAPYNPVAAAAAVERMRALYREKGYYQALVRTVIEPSGEGRVRLKAVIEEGDKYKLFQVTLVGVKSFPEDKVRAEMKTEPWTIFSWLSSTSGLLQKDLLQEDRQRIVSFYQDHGFLEVKVSEPEITVDDTAKGLRVVIQIDEGLQFRLGTMAQQGDDFLSLEQIKGIIGLNEGDIFRRSAFSKGLYEINQRYASRGYAFVKLDYTTKLNPATLTIDVIFIIDRGPEARFGRITISGNVSTRDKVVRRELTFSEGDIFNSTALARSRQKVNNLGFFESVELVPRPTGDNLVDIDIVVKERLTGAITFGIGYSSEDKITGQLRISENNLFGRGHTLALTFEKSPVRANYSLSFNEPSLFDSPWSFGFSIYDMMREYDEYHRKSIGGQMTFGRSLGEYIRSYVRLKHETVTVSDVKPTASSYIKDQRGEKTTDSVRLSVVRDTRDNYMNPTRGNRSSVAGEYAGGILGGDNYFTKFELEHSTYMPLFANLVGMIHGEYGSIRGFGTEQATDLLGRNVYDANGKPVMVDREPPIYEKFYLGGILTLRGFPYREVGPKDENGDPKGGYQELFFNAEVIVPVVPTQGFNLVMFYDTGNAWDKSEPLKLSDLRQSAGVGIRWMSPIGPFRLEWGYILDRQPGEPKSDWAFMIGNFF